MKTLLIPFLLMCGPAFANEILTDAELSRKQISLVKEYQVQETVLNSSEFRECREKNNFQDPAASAQAAVDCFTKKLDGKKPEEIARLSEALGLQSFRLVGSKNKADITSYLSDKMYESLTGVSKNQQNLEAMMENMKFGKKRFVDQKVFIELYSTQLIKNSLFEISRFCFENFRKIDTSDEGKDFITYWDQGLNALAASGKNDIKNYTDTGARGFGNVDTNSKDTVYKDLLKGMGTNDEDSVQKISGFFDSCSTKIVPLCEVFEKNPNSETKRGANACLTKAKLQATRKALANAQKLSLDFDSMNVSQMTIELQQNINPYQAVGDNSIDGLTNYTSRDMLEGGLTNTGNTELKDKCINEPHSKECEDFIVVDGSYERLEHQFDMQLDLQKEAEKAKVKAIGQQGIEEYLTSNGHFDLLNKWKADPTLNIENEIEKIFEARKKATLSAFKSKVGRRQMSESDAQDTDLKNKNISENAQDAKEERARLAQVVMFNNIITGHLELRRAGSDEVVGTNVRVIEKELQALTAANVDQGLFTNLKSSIAGKTGNTDNASFAEISILDNILGKKD